MDFDYENLPAVRVTNLVKRYKNGTLAIRRLDFTVRKGEAVAILGANGAGKTTFLRQLTTELKPTSGTIEIFGLDAVREAGRAKLTMGVTPQEAGVFETLTAREHLELFGRLKGLGKAAARAASDELLEALELRAEAKKTVGTLSGGQRRRILVGLALIGAPPLLILDEPTTGLDPQSRRTVWALIKRAIGTGTTVIFSTHYLEEAENLSTRIAFISGGELVADGSLAALRARLPQKYRLSYANGSGPFPQPRVEFFETFAGAQQFIGDRRIGEYQLATVSLENVYFSIVGERIGEERAFEDE
ncbi:MAG: ABC transporter ATP-binding protein [Acidobacteria bacterium]|nr:ABC transporter ATP-binding protein [Acidobacteriota bacterium]